MATLSEYLIEIGMQPLDAMGTEQKLRRWLTQKINHLKPEIKDRIPVAEREKMLDFLWIVDPPVEEFIQVANRVQISLSQICRQAHRKEDMEANNEAS